MLCTCVQRRRGARWWLPRMALRILTLVAFFFFYVFVDDCPWGIKQKLNNFHWKSVHFRRKVIDEIRRHLRVRRISWWRRRRSCCSTCRAAKPTKGAARHFQITYLMFSLMFRENQKKTTKTTKLKNMVFQTFGMFEWIFQNMKFVKFQKLISDWIVVLVFFCKIW